MSCNIIINEETIDVLKDVIKSNEFNNAKDLVRSGKTIELRTTWDSLHMAASLGHHQVVEFLIQNGASVDSTSPLEYSDTGFTPLHIAAQRNHLECARILLKYGASVSSKIEGVCDPIYLAVFYGHAEMATLLLDHGANVNARVDNNFFETTEDHLLEVDFLGEKMHKTLWQDHNLPLLHCSILRKLNEMTKLLLDRGADVDLRTSLGKTTLMQAVEVNNDKLVKYLIKEKNANADDRDIFGKPVIYFLMLNANRIISPYSRIESEQRREKKRILNILLCNQANIDVRFPEDSNYSNIIHYMIRYGFHEGVIRLLYFSDVWLIGVDLNVGHLLKINPDYLTPDIENDLNYIQILYASFHRMSYALATYAISRRMIGFPYDENLILEYAKSKWLTKERFTNEMNLCENEINDELNLMKHTTIGNSNITAYYLLTCKKYQIVKLMSDKRLNITDFEKNFVNKKLFYYYWLLHCRIKAAKITNNNLKECTELLSNLFINQLPMDCCEMIVSSFDDFTFDELSNLLSEQNLNVRSRLNVVLHY